MTPGEPGEPDSEKYPDEAPGSIRLAGLVMAVAEEAIDLGLVDVDPIVPLDYRRILCLTDGSRIDIRMIRLPRCMCGGAHARGGATPCASVSRVEKA